MSMEASKTPVVGEWFVTTEGVREEEEEQADVDGGDEGEGLVTVKWYDGPTLIWLHPDTLMIWSAPPGCSLVIDLSWFTIYEENEIYFSVRGSYFGLVIWR